MGLDKAAASSKQPVLECDGCLGTAAGSGLGGEVLLFPLGCKSWKFFLGVEQYPLTGPCFQMLNGLGGENLKDYWNVPTVKYGRCIKMWTDAAWVLMR